MTFKSTLIDIESGEKTCIDTEDVQVSANQSLFLIRGGNFFTSGFMLKGKTGSQLVASKAHFNRLTESYKVLYNQTELPFDESTFNTYVKEAIAANSDQDKAFIQIFLLGGNSVSIGGDEQGYQSGFSGNVKTLFIKVAEWSEKPEWVFQEGLSVLQVPYQRETALAKPTLYMGGLQSQHLLNAINLHALLITEKLGGTSGRIDGLIQELVTDYHQLNPDQQQSYRYALTDCRYQKAQFSTQSVSERYPGLDEAFYQLIESGRSESALALESVFTASILHEAMFVSPTSPHFVLEGSTFSFFALTKAYRWVFLPTTGNSDKPNEGDLLQSTSVQMVLDVIKSLDFEYEIRPIPTEELGQLRRLFAVSSTRFRLTNEEAQFAYISHVNGQKIGAWDAKSESMHHAVTRQLRRLMLEGPLD